VGSPQTHLNSEPCVECFCLRVSENVLRGMWWKGPNTSDWCTWYRTGCWTKCSPWLSHSISP